MIVKTKLISKPYDWRQTFSIEVDGIKRAIFVDGDIEYNCIARNFSGVFGIDNLMRMAYNAGKNGETFEVTEEFEEEN